MLRSHVFNKQLSCCSYAFVCVLATTKPCNIDMDWFLSNAPHPDCWLCSCLLYASGKMHESKYWTLAFRLWNTTKLFSVYVYTLACNPHPTHTQKHTHTSHIVHSFTLLDLCGSATSTFHSFRLRERLKRCRARQTNINIIIWLEKWWWLQHK